MINKQLVKESAVLINLAYTEGRFADQYKKNLDTLTTDLVKAKLSDISTQKPEDLYEDIIGSLSLDKQELLKNEAFLNLFSLYKDKKSKYDLKEQTEEQIYQIAQKDYLTDIKKNIIDEIKKTYPKEELSNLLETENIVNLSSTYLDKAKNSSLERKEVLKTNKDLSNTLVSVEPSQAIIDKFTEHKRINGNTIKASFKDGYVDISEGDGPKDASFLVKKSYNTTPPTLHISFRGTDDSNTSKNVAHYFMEDYPNMNRQYKKLRGVLNAIIQEQTEIHKKEYPNEPMPVHFSGHSLGAAMAEKAIDTHKDNKDVSYTCVAFANPGSKHYKQHTINRLDTLRTYLKNKSFMTVGGTSVIENAIDKLSLRDNLIARIAVFLGAADAAGRQKEFDPRMLTINHKFDLIPKFGSAIFEKPSDNLITIDNQTQTTENNNFLVNALTTAHHNSYNYGNEAIKMVDNGLYEEKAQEISKNNVLSKLDKMRVDLTSKIRNKLKFAN